ncbi:MAG: hypothetical protein V4760_03830, partial [Bdellovibrionota bacterium]
MSVWHRRFLFVFFVLGVVFIGRQSPSGSGEMNVTEFSDVAESAPESAPEDSVAVAVAEPEVVVAAP